MSPTALEAPGHHDSFSLPVTRELNGTKVHPSARRSPEGGLIKVESEDVVYEGDEIRAKFTDRGAAVTSESPVFHH
jgi:myo-inositol-1-phosphate synthase